jgi:hypothetical protein
VGVACAGGKRLGGFSVVRGGGEAQGIMLMLWRSCPGDETAIPVTFCLCSGTPSFLVRNGRDRSCSGGGGGRDSGGVRFYSLRRF